MPDVDPTIATPAVILKPLPFEVKGAPGCFFGGLPRMPDDMEWPTFVSERSPQNSSKPKKLINNPYHFLAQIDLGAVPRCLDVAGLRFPMPELPQTGTLYIFWNAEFGKLETRVLYTPFSGDDLVERVAPRSLLNLQEIWDECTINIEGLSPCGRILKRQNFVLLPYLTSEVDDVDWEYTIAQKDDQPEELVDALHAASASEVLGEVKVPAVRFVYPWLPALSEEKGAVFDARKLVNRLTARFSKQAIPISDGLDMATGIYTVPETFPWRWSVIHDVAQRLKNAATITNQNISSFCDEVPFLLHVWADVPNVADKWLAQCTDEDAPVSPSDATEFRGWLRWISTAAERVVVDQQVDPDLIEKCQPLIEALNKSHPHMVEVLNFSEKRVTRKKTAAYEIVEQIVPLIRCVENYAPGETERTPFVENSKHYFYQIPTPYFLARDLRPAIRGTLGGILDDTLISLTNRVWCFQNTDDLPTDLSAVASLKIIRETSIESDYRLIQMFGTSIRKTSSLDPDKEYVILFQLSDGFGLPIRLDSYVIQFLLTREDLASSRFDRVIAIAGI